MHNKKSSYIFFFTPAIGWGILICYFSLLPSAEIPNSLISVQDFILHFLIYSALGMLLYFGANRYTMQKLPAKGLQKILAICVSLGLSLEILQELFAAGRHFELSDILFNTLGAMVVLLLHQRTH